MEMSTVNSNANSNNTTNINNTTTNSNQLIGTVTDDTHLQSHQQKSHQLMIAVNKSVSNSFANNIDTYSNSIQNFNNSNLTITAHRETTDITKLATQDCGPRHRHNWKNGESELSDDDLVLEIKEILIQLVMKVTGEIFPKDTLDEQQQQPLVQFNNEHQEESLKHHASNIIEKECEYPPEAELDKSIASSGQMQTQEDHDDSREEKAKDIITLRNLEISPPPIAPEEPSRNDNPSADTYANIDENSRDKKRQLDSPDTQQNDSIESGGRSKRQRKQTKLFQAGDVQSDYSPEEADSSISSPRPTRTKARPSSRNRKKAATSLSITDVEPPVAQVEAATNQQDVIFYEKNDYLAIRNEQNNFFLCQLTENVRVLRPLIKVRWLDMKDGEDFYFLTSEYDKIPQASIIMPVSLNKLKTEKKGEQHFTLDDQVRENIMERLKRSLNITTESASTQDSSIDG